MITTKENARKIIKESYGKDFKFKIRMHKCVLGIRPTYETVLGLPTIAWYGLPDNRVRLGTMNQNHTIDWTKEF